MRNRFDSFFPASWWWELQALDQTVTVKGLSNAIQLGSIFSAMKATAKGRVGLWSNTIVTGVNLISQYSEAVYAALERIQRSNLALSGGNWPNVVAANQTARDILDQTDRIQWLGRRMHGERRSCFRAANRIVPKIESDKTVSTRQHNVMQYSTAQPSTAHCSTDSYSTVQ